MKSNKLEDLKEEKNLKGRDIAKDFNIAESTYSEWEHSKIAIPTRRLVEFSNYYEVNIDYLLNLSNERLPITTANKINLVDIGNRLKDIRKKLNLSLRDLGSKLNTAFSSLASYERGEKLIQVDTLISLCKLSDTSIDYILGTNLKK